MTVTWKDCGAKGTVTDVQPSTMTLGQNTVFTSSGSIDKTYKGKVCEPSTFKITKLGLHIGDLTYEGLDCPVKAGEMEQKMDVMIKSSISKSMATSEINFTAVNESGEKTLCLTINTA